MSDHTPKILTDKEWREIAELPEVREAWGLENETPEQFERLVYGAKFDFDGHDLYILIDEVGQPMILQRVGGELLPTYRGD